MPNQSCVCKATTGWDPVSDRASLILTRRLGHRIRYSQLRGFGDCGWPVMMIYLMIMIMCFLDNTTRMRILPLLLTKDKINFPVATNEH